MFSYLPAGTPPWPTTVPQLPTSSKVAATNPLAATAVKDAKPKRSASSVLLAAAVLVLIPILGAVATLGALYSKGEFPPQTAARPQATITLPQATPAGSATPGANATAQSNNLPTPNSFSQESNKDLNLSFKYPSDWQAESPQKSSDNSVYVYVHPSVNAVVRIFFWHFSDAASKNFSSPDDLNQQQLQVITQAQQASTSTIQNVQLADPHPTIGGAKWSEQEITYTDGNGNKLHTITLSIQHGPDYYNVLWFTSADLYNEAQQKYTQPMLDSLQFLS
jgi:hypothetical protein